MFMQYLIFLIRKLTEQKFMGVILSGILDIAKKCILFQCTKETRAATSYGNTDDVFPRHKSGKILP